jgi:hypothetical protein
MKCRHKNHTYGVSDGKLVGRCKDCGAELCLVCLRPLRRKKGKAGR